MFEHFPYTDFHQLNLDWIIKIAKDFLDQYTHIQEIIEQGKTDIQTLTDSGTEAITTLTNASVEELTTLTNNLKTLLNEAYETHSAELATQLANAIRDLNSWYTEHQNYLDATLVQKTNQFIAAADAKLAEVLASIPADYSALGAEVEELSTAVTPTLQEIISFSTEIEGTYIRADGLLASNEETNMLPLIPLSKGDKITLTARGYQTAMAMIAVHTPTGFNPVVISDGNTLHDYSYTATEDCYVAFTYYNTYNYSAVKFISAKQTREEIKQNIPVSFSQKIDGKFIFSATGALQDNEEFSYMRGLFLKAGESISLYCAGYSTAVAIISKDNTGRFEPVIISVDNTVRFYTYTATEETAIALSFRNNYYYKAWIQTNPIYTLEDTVMPEITIDTTNAEDGFVGTSDNPMTLAYSEGFKHVNIPADVGDIIHAKVRGYNTAVSAIARKEEYSYFKIIPCIDSTVRDYYYLVPRKMIITVSYNSDYTHEIRIIRNYIKNYMESEQQDNYQWYLFPKLCGIGDSLMCGTLQIDNGPQHTVMGDAWLTYVARRTGSAKHFYAQGGITAKDWIQEFMQDLQDGDSYNAYFISLGTNERYTSAYPLGDITDPAGSNTFVGYYKEIINAIRTKSPHCAIFCISLYNSQPDHFIWSSMIEQIANLYDNCFYLDFINRSEYHVETIGDFISDDLAHFSTLGYAYMANLFMKLVNEQVLSHTSFFRFFGEWNSVL